MYRGCLSHSCQPYRFWRDSTDNLPTVPPPRPNALLHRLTCACSFKVLCAECVGAAGRRVNFAGRLSHAYICVIELEGRSYSLVHINNHDANISINYNHVIIIILYVKWVESVGVSMGVWFVPTFLFEKLELISFNRTSNWYL